MNDQNDETPEKLNGEQPKHITIIFLSDGSLDMTMNRVNSFDLWSIARYLELRGDEAYINAQTKARLLEGQTGKEQPLIHLPNRGMRRHKN